LLGGVNSKYFQQNILNLTTTGTGTDNRIVGGNTNAAGDYVAPILRVEGGGGTFAGFLGGATATENNFAFYKGGGGTTTLTNTGSTYTGVTTAFAGVLSISSVANAGLPSSIGAFPLAGAPIIGEAEMPGLLIATGTGGALRYTGATAASDRGFGMWGASVIDVDSASSLTLGASATAGNHDLIINGTVGSSFSLGATTFAEGKSIASNSNFTIASLTGLVKITNETLTFRGLGTGSVTGAISPNQTLNPAGAAIFLTVNKDDGGTWNFNGTNTYNGATAVNNGLLRINGSTLAANAVTVANAAGLGGTGTINGAVTLNGTSRIDLGNGAVGTLTLAATGTGLNIAGSANANSLIFDLAAGGATTDVIAVTNGANMNSSGAGVVVPHQLGGAGNRLTAGTYDIMTAASGTALDAGATKFRLETTKAFGQTFSLAASTATALKLTTTQVAAGPSAVTLGAASWNVAGNFGGTLPEYNSNVTIDSALASTLDSSTDINSLTFGASAASVTIAPGTAPTGTPASMLVIEGGTGITTGGTGTHTISAKVGLAASQTWTVNTDLTVSGVVSDFGGEYSLTKAGTGVLTLSGANTYAGNTAVSAGTLMLGHGTALGRTTGAVSVASGAVLALNGQTVNNASITINGTGIASGGALISSTGTGLVNSTVVMASDSSIGGAGNLTLVGTTSTSVSGMLRGNFNLTKVGAGTLQLNAANSFGSSSTTFTIAAGTVQLGNAIGLGNAANNIVVNSGAMLNLNNQTVLNPNPLTINGTGVSSGGALQNGTYAGPITLGSNSSIVGINNTILLNSGGITGGFNLELGGTSLLNRIDSTIATGAGTLTKVGAGTWNLRGASTYTGGTSHTAGTLQFSKLVSMPAVGTVAVSLGTTLIVNVGGGTGEWSTGTSGAGTLGGLLAGTGGQGAPVTYGPGLITLGIDTSNASVNNVTVGSNAITSVINSRFHDSAVQTYSGVIANPAGATLGLNKLGLNTLALTGANSYTGVTNISGGGVLQVSNLQNGGLNSSIGNYAAGAAGLILNGGTLQYTGGTTTTDRGFTLSSSNSIIDVSTPGTALTMGASSLGALTFAATGSAGSSLTLSATTLTGNATLVGGIPLTVTALSGTTQNVTLTGDVTVTTATFSGNGTITATNGKATINTLANSATNTITLRGVGTASGSANNNGNNLSLGIVSGVIANGNAGAATMSITKDDAGTWAFANANTYTGVTTITNGVLRLDHATALPGGIGATGGTSALTFNGAAVLGLTVASGDFTRGLGSGGSQVQFSNAGGWAAYGADRSVDLGGAGASVNWGTATTGFNGKQLNLGAASATHMVTLVNPVDLAGAVRTVLVEDGPAAIEAKMLGAITGSGGLTKIGSGKLLLPTANPGYTGVTSVNLGTLVVTDGAALGTTAGNTIVAVNGNLGATLDVQADIGLEPLTVGGLGVGGIGALRTSTGTGTVGGLITLTGKTMFGSEGTLNIDGTLTAAGNGLTTVGSGVITFGAAGSLASLYSLTVTDGTTNVNSAIGAAAGNANVVVGDGFGGTAKLRFGSVSQTLSSLTIGAGATVVFTSGTASGAFSGGDKGAGFGGGATVPEPGTLGLLLVGALGMLNRRRRA
jgi:autotransporter-associated beta strand protein